jgi:hypothetical protein
LQVSACTVLWPENEVKCYFPPHDLTSENPFYLCFSLFSIYLTLLLSVFLLSFLINFFSFITALVSLTLPDVSPDKLEHNGMRSFEHVVVPYFVSIFFVSSFFSPWQSVASFDAGL